MTGREQVAAVLPRAESESRTGVAGPGRVLRLLRRREGAVVPPPGGWALSGACTGPGVEPGWFQGEHPGGESAGFSAAVEVCRGCPVRVECLMWAVEGGDWWSVAGGTEPRERVESLMWEVGLGVAA